jgi:hypothetical protein
LQKTEIKNFFLKLDSFGKKTPGGDWQTICSPEKVTRWFAVRILGYNAPFCSGINQVFVIGQFISQKNQTGIGKEMHSGGRRA